MLVDTPKQYHQRLLTMQQYHIFYPHDIWCKNKAFKTSVCDEFSSIMYKCFTSFNEQFIWWTTFPFYLHTSSNLPQINPLKINTDSKEFSYRFPLRSCTHLQLSLSLYAIAYAKAFFLLNGMQLPDIANDTKNYSLS